MGIKHTKKVNPSTKPAHTKPNDLVPTETLLKKRKNADSHKQKLAREEQAKKKAAKIAEKKKKHASIFKRAETFVKDYRLTEQEHARFENAFSEPSKIEVPSEPKLLFVMRINNPQRKLIPQAKLILKAFRITQVYSGVFLMLNEATAELLRVIEPFVAFGYPSLNSVRTLINKRANIKNPSGEKGTVTLTDNSVIEDALGKYGIICVEDLIHEIYTLGPHFKEATYFLVPFQLSSPTGGWGVRAKFSKFIEGEGLGEKAYDINAIIEAQN